MKERYETPEMEIVEFETEDIITTSGETPIEPGEVPMAPLQEIDKVCWSCVESEQEMKSRKKIITVSGICIVVLAVVIGAAELSRKAGQRTASNNTASGQTTAGDNGENGDLPMMPIASGDLEADGAAAQQREKSSAEKSAPEDASDMEDQKGNAQSDDQSSIVAKQDQSSPAVNIQKPSKPQGDNPKDDAKQNAGTESNQADSNNSGSSGKTDAKSNNNTSDGKKNDKSDDQDSGGKNDKSDNKDSDQKSPDTIELPFIPAK